jgi:hypothetical protein
LKLAHDVVDFKAPSFVSFYGGFFSTAGNALLVPVAGEVTG